jgi:hypothetical protein
MKKQINRQKKLYQCFNCKRFAKYFVILKANILSKELSKVLVLSVADNIPGLSDYITTCDDCFELAVYLIKD